MTFRQRGYGMIKISRPTPKDVYLRHRLFERLDKLRRFPVIWTSAPAGSGKTTLISSYIENRNIPCIWYQLDNADTDVATFFYYLREAAKRASPRRRLSLPLFTPEYIQGISTFILRFFERLYACLGNPFIFVFDNFQEISLDAVHEEAIYSALTIIPEGINVVIISRNELPTFLYKFKTNRSIGIMRWEDIRLTEEESKEIISMSADILPAKKIMHRLHKLSDGWAAGLILLYEGCKKGAPIPEFAGKRVFDEVYEYVASEIFRHLDHKTQEFFLTTAFLPKMTVRMAERLSGNRSAGPILETMDHNNFFITRHAGPKAVYEYHPLFRHFFRSQARAALSPEQLFSVRQSAAGILEKAGMTDSAVSLLKDISDWEAMTGIILGHSPEMIKQGRHNTVQSWINSLPLDVLEGNPWLLFWEGMSILPFSPAKAGTGFEKAFSKFQNAGETIGSMLSASGAINSIAYQFNDFTPLDHWYDVLNDLAVKSGNFPDEEIEASVIAGLVTAAILREKNAEEFAHWEQRALNIVETPATINMKAQALRFIFWRCLLWKGPYEALPLLNELRRLSRLRWAQPLLSIVVQSSEVQFDICSGLKDHLIESVEKGLEISARTGIHIEDMWFCVHAAAGLVGCMDLKGAQSWMDKIPPMAEGWPNWAKEVYHLQKMRMALINNKVGEALSEGKLALDFATMASSPIATANVRLTLAESMQRLGNYDEASNLIEQVKSYAIEKKANQMMIEVLKSDAQAAFQKGDEAQGLLLLSKALAMAREKGSVFTLFDNPIMTTKLCERALEAGIEVEYVREIIKRRGLVPEKPPIQIENWPWPVKIYTLGRFTVVKDGSPLKFSGKAKQMPLKLLKVLISLGGREITGDAVSELLWQDAEGDQAHQSFETNLHRLRRLIGNSEAIRFSDGKLTLDNRFCWVDVWAFERLLAQADEYEKDGKTEKVQAATEKAINLYRNNFLAGDKHEAWVISPAERLKTKFINKLLHLCRSLENSGNINNAIDLYKRGLEVDDCVEEIYQRLMILSLRLGKKADALAVYDRCTKVLHACLGIGPSEETEKIRASILSERGPLRVVKGRL
jgi:LuxR family transcriptional regulator, maltose regulon positive regulatory protein